VTANQQSLEIRLAVGDYGLSALRLMEHTELGQINPFDRAISARPELNDTAAFIDVVRFVDDTFSLAGFSLADLRAGQMPANSRTLRAGILNAMTETDGIDAFVQEVSSHLARCSVRQALRNQHHPFLPSAQSTDVLGVPSIFSTLQQRLRSMGKSKAGGEQWHKTIENFQKKGLRAEEFEWSELIPDLSLWHEGEQQFTALELADLCNFKALRLSVIPVVSNAERQIQFAHPPERALKKTKRLPKAQMGQTRGVTGFDPVLGYRIEEVVHQTLWGAESHWQAVKHDGTVLDDAWGQTLHRTRDVATALAAFHASQNFPKRLALGKFAKYSWSGGQDYREWLITLPYLPATYLSGHFNVRNVLAHVRCDMRLGADDERVLMLQEVQSDWAQRARRAISVGVMRQDDEVPPPFMKEWAALAMKLVLLHAAHQGIEAVAWTRGAQQVQRWNGLGAAGLIELYDRTLPKEVNRIMKPFGGACETLGVFVPTNFSIKQTESGYEGYSPSNDLLGIAPTLENARVFVPDQGHELLFEVHGVRLPVVIRKAILDSGFPAWG
jgi:hypothetical protein